MSDILINNFSLTQIVFYFTIYAFLGWVSEVSYAYAVRGKFVNRGFLYGPFCPIYGSGLTLIIVLLNSYKNNIFILFILATIVTSILEYVTGYVLEKFFNQKWWDYTDDPLNLHGRICLGFSIIWGIACVGVIKLIHPIINILVNKLPTVVVPYIFAIIIIYFLLDFTTTVLSLIEFNKVLKQLSSIKAQILAKVNSITSEASKEVGNLNLDDHIGELKEKYNATLLKLKRNHIRLLDSFPYGGFNKNSNILSELKKLLSNLR